MLSLLPYQVAPANHLESVLRKFGSALDGSDGGIGKTYVGSELVRRLNLPTLVVCPKISCSMWERVARLMGTEVSAINYEMLQTGRTPYGCFKKRRKRNKQTGEMQWVNSKFVFAEQIRMLIFDEVHRCAGTGTNNAKMLDAADSNGRTVLALSATLADNIFKLATISRMLGLRSPGISTWQWLVNKGCCRGEFGGLSVRGGIPAHRKLMRRMNELIFPARGVRVRISELGSAFPETQITAELFDIDKSGRINELYKLISEQLVQLRNTQLSDIDPEHPLTKITRARMEIELLKCPILVELANEAIEQGRSAAIFVNYSGSIEYLSKALDTKCIIDGNTPNGIKQKNIADFQHGCSRAIICNSDAGGVSVSLHDVTGEYPRTALISPGNSAEKFRQILFRVHRAEGKSKSLQRIILIANSVEEPVYKTLNQSLDRLDLLNDGDLSPKFV